MLATSFFGVAIGIATTAAYTAAATIMPASARGTGFGLLTTASLAGLAVSPIVSGMLSAVSIRAVFLLDTIFLVLLAGLVRRLMVTAPLTANVGAGDGGSVTRRFGARRSAAARRMRARRHEALHGLRS